MTGEGVVMPNEDAAEVERRIAASEAKLNPSGEVGRGRRADLDRSASSSGPGNA
jgi:hypothetical protein